MFGSDARPEERMLSRRDVTDREDIGIACAQRRVDEHAAVGPHRQAGRLREVGVRRRTDGDQYDVRVDDGPVAEAQARRRAARRW